MHCLAMMRGMNCPLVVMLDASPVEEKLPGKKVETPEEEARRRIMSGNGYTAEGGFTERLCMMPISGTAISNQVSRAMVARAAAQVVRRRSGIS